MIPIALACDPQRRFRTRDINVPVTEPRTLTEGAYALPRTLSRRPALCPPLGTARVEPRLEVNL